MNLDRPGAALLILVLWGAAGGCADLSGSLPRPDPRPAGGAFRAGAARVDITPPPGIPMGGHSVAGSIARGCWTRLHARAIYFEDADGRGLCLVSCDLWGIPGGLVDRVAEIVSGHDHGRHLGRERIVLSATHTHQSPGNYSTCKMYNGFASCRDHFDDALFEFLARQISAAVLQAANPDRIRPCKVTHRDARVPLLMRNRSLECFLHDPEASGILEANKDLPAEGGLPPEVPRPNYPDDAYRAVNPSLHVLRVAADPGDDVIAVAAFVGVHPTAMHHLAELYQSDLFGAAGVSVEQALRERGKDPVVALFNGAEGDVSPTWSTQDRRDVLRCGEVLARDILGLLSGGTEIQGPIRLNFGIVPVAGRNFTDEEKVKRKTACRAFPGAATLGGAEDGRSVFFDLGWREGVRNKSRTADHGSKQFALDPSVLPFDLKEIVNVTGLLLAADAVPRSVPLGVYRIGSVALCTLPGEFTTVMGQRICRTLRERLDGPTRAVLPIGLANEYVSYFTTPEEYDLQHYEGASTLYGPASGPLIQHELGCLASSLGSGPSLTYPYRFAYDPGPRKRFTSSDAMESAPYQSGQGLPEFLIDLSTGKPKGDFPSHRWEDVIQELDPSEPGKRILPKVFIEASDGNEADSWKRLKVSRTLQAGDGTSWTWEAEESSDGLNLVTVLLHSGAGKTTWCAYWLVPPGLNKARKYKFVVETLGGNPSKSPPFVLP